MIVNPNQPGYTNGQTVTLTANSVPGEEPFHAWLGDIVTRSNSITLVMTNNKTVYARFTPIIFTWTNVLSGDWNVGANWTPNLEPGTNDTVIITRGVTVTLNAPPDCADVTLGDSVNTPTLTGSGTLRVRGSFLWTSGIMRGSGRTVIDSGATMVAISQSGVTLDARTLENGGTVLWTGAGNINMFNGAVITNRAGALFHVQNAARFGLAGGGPNGRFDNAGTFRKSVSSGTATLLPDISFNNSGRVEIQTGTLDLGFGGTHSGSFDVPTGTTLRLSGAHSANASSSISGAGQLIVSGGAAVNLAGLVNVSGNNTVSGFVTANFTGNYICTNNTLTISGGTANFSSTGTVAPAVLNFSSGQLGGTATVTVLNTMNWTSGTMGGGGRTVIEAGATLNAAIPGGVLLNGRTLENGGTVLWTGAGSMVMNPTAVITNRAGALFEMQNAVSIVANNGACRFDNAGTFRKSVNPGTITFPSSVRLNNSGTLDIQSGILDLGGGTHSGSFTVPAGTALVLSGDHTAAGSSSITGAGQLRVNGGFATTLAGLVNVSGSNTFSAGLVTFTGNYICTNNVVTISGGTVNFSGTGLVSPAVMNFTSGELGGTGTVTVNSVMNWTSGTMSGSGRTIIPVGATLNAAIPGGVSLNGRTLENGGAVLWTGAGFLAMNNGAVITNRAGALFEMQNAISIIVQSGFSQFDNAGTFRKSADTGTITFPASFNNSGTVDIRSGILAANGGYASSPNALLNCALGGTTPGTGYGRLQVAGTVTLDGALSVDLTNGFSPALNDSFTVLTAGTRNGAFANFFYPSNAVTMQLSNSPNYAIVRVSGIVVPAPMLFTPVLSSSNVLLSWTAVSNKTYRLEYTLDLGLTNWDAVSGDVTTSSNKACALDALTSSNRFYRVRVLP